MRKLLALSLVLSLTPVAGAFMLSFSTEDMDPGAPGFQIGSGTYLISVITDVETSSFNLSLLISGNFIDYQPGEINPLFTNKTLSSIGTKYLPGYLKSISGRMLSPTDPLVPAGDWVYRFYITFSADYEIITIDDYKGVIGGGMGVKTTLNGTEIYMSPVTIEAGIPEPTTLALLGLGGLFLRRKK